MKVLKSLLNTGLIVGACMLFSANMYGQSKTDMPDYQANGSTAYEPMIAMINPDVKTYVMNNFADFTDAQLDELRQISEQRAAVQTGRQASLLYARMEAWQDSLSPALQSTMPTYNTSFN